MATQQSPTPAQEKALELRRRIQAGETVPLDELRDFIRLSNQSLEKQRKAEDKDVDFF